MHKLAEKIADCMKAKIESRGIDNIEGQDLVELGMWTDIIKDLVCYDKDKKIIEAMDEAEDAEESMKYIEMYEKYPEERRYYRGQPRDSRGRYMSGGRRMGYHEPMYHMTPEMYREHTPEHYRDMDRNEGRMYYTETGMDHFAGDGKMMRDSREGRSGMSRRTYMETKEMHPGNTPEDKQKKVHELEKYMNELATDVTEMISGATPEEKTMLKQKMQTLVQKIV